MKIGVMLPYAGPASIWRTGSETCAYLALAASAGLGPHASLYFVDCGATPQATAAAARHLLEDSDVDIVVGMQLSHQREVAADVFKGKLPYIYTPQYEGADCGPGVIPIGLQDDEVLGPGIEKIGRIFNVTRWSFVGNDYLWPLKGVSVAHRHVERCGGQLVHTHFRPFDDEDFDPLLAEILASDAQAVIVGLLGEESVRFHRAFAAYGLAERIPRFSLALDETLLWALEVEQTANLFACQTYYLNHRSSARADVVARHRKLFGDTAPPLTSMSLGIYDGVSLALRLGQVAQSPNRQSLSDFVSQGLDRAKALSLLGLADPITGRQHPRVAAACAFTFREMP
ncbi:MAG: ABC transporter substrate-binding protein [Pseudomonadota bacterium]